MIRLLELELISIYIYLSIYLHTLFYINKRGKLWHYSRRTLVSHSFRQHPIHFFRHIWADLLTTLICKKETMTLINVLHYNLINESIRYFYLLLFVLLFMYITWSVTLLYILGEGKNVNWLLDCFDIVFIDFCSVKNLCNRKVTKIMMTKYSPCSTANLSRSKGNPIVVVCDFLKLQTSYPTHSHPRIHKKETKVKASENRINLNWIVQDILKSVILLSRNHKWEKILNVTHQIVIYGSMFR